MPGFEEWESFYVIVGAAAGALIGLQFVVMTLLADKPGLASPEAGAAFATPNVVHFSAALLLSALMRVPWHSIEAAATGWGIVGFAGLVYLATVLRRALRREPPRPAGVGGLALPRPPAAPHLCAAARDGIHGHLALRRSRDGRGPRHLAAA